MRRIAVIGGGPAGMMASLSAAMEGAQVTLFEKNEKLGKKLYITGKGRCNLTNACDTEDIFDNIVTNRKFMYSAIYSFTNTDTVSFFENRGLKLKEERGKRIFPVSDKSSDVIKTLEKALREEGVRVRLNSAVRDIEDLDFDAVIIATGGLSYPSTGSTGDGYRFAEKEGHKITVPLPSLVPLRVEEVIVGTLEGLSLKNVAIRIIDERGRAIHSDFGEMLFTSRGVTGPLILSASALIAKKLDKKEKLILTIDLKPALDEKQLDERILRDFSENLNKDFRNSLGKLLPSKMIPAVITLSGIEGGKKVNEITKEERASLVNVIKNLSFTLSESEGFSQAVITQGGVNVRDINPSTMESKLRPGLYFAGEVIDVDAFTGGFNIQIALSTGWLAGQSAAVSDTVFK